MFTWFPSLILDLCEPFVSARDDNYVISRFTFHIPFMETEASISMELIEVVPP